MTSKPGKIAKATARKPSRQIAVAGRRDAGRSRAQLQAQIEEKVSQITESNRQLRRKIFDLYTIFEISRNFNAVLKYQSLLDSFIFTCLGQVGALKGAVFLQGDGPPGCFGMAKGKGSGAFPSHDEFFRTDSPLAQYLTKLNRPVLTADLMKESFDAPEMSIVAYFHPGIVVPLIYQTRMIGIFALSDKIQGRQFQMDDVEFLSIIGNQIAVAIENARLYENEKMAIQQLRAAQQQLVQTERLAALGELSAKVAHEVNNPLGIIKNYLLLLERATTSNGPAHEYTEVVHQEIDRIAGIVRQLLEFHRPKPLTFARLRATQIVGEVLTLMERPLASNNIELVRRFGADSAEVMGSADSLKQVFLNLVINARDAMPEGGRLAVTIRQDYSDFLIEFCDTGPGIDPEIVPRIFDPFFTTKEPGKGTGLGLSICFGVVKNHNGSITFSNTNPGGCFAIRLPLATRESTGDQRT